MVLFGAAIALTWLDSLLVHVTVIVWGDTISELRAWRSDLFGAYLILSALVAITIGTVTLTSAAVYLWLGAFGLVAIS